jgi:uncharacterized membrane protein YdcZ (DUF606 family)
MSGTDPRPGSSRGRPSWWRLTGGIGAVSLQGTTALLHPWLGAVLAVAALATAATVMLVLIGAAVFGSERLSERAFRLLRWAADRPEPRSPRSGRYRPTAARAMMCRVRRPGGSVP